MYLCMFEFYHVISNSFYWVVALCIFSSRALTYDLISVEENKATFSDDSDLVII